MEETGYSYSPTLGFKLVLVGYPPLLGILFLLGRIQSWNNITLILFAGFLGSLLFGILIVGESLFYFRKHDIPSDEISADILNQSNPLILSYALWGNAAEPGGVASGFLLRGVRKKIWDVHITVMNSLIKKVSISLLENNGERDISEKAFIQSLFKDNERNFVFETPEENGTPIEKHVFENKKALLMESLSEAILVLMENGKKTLFEVDEDQEWNEIAIKSSLFTLYFTLFCFGIYAITVMSMGEWNTVLSTFFVYIGILTGYYSSKKTRKFFFIFPPFAKGKGVIPPEPMSNSADAHEKCMRAVFSGMLSCLPVTGALILAVIFVLRYNDYFTSIFLSAFLISIPFCAFLSSSETPPPEDMNRNEAFIFHIRLLEVGRSFEKIRVAARNLFGYSPWTPRREILEKLSLPSALALGVAPEFYQCASISQDHLKAYLAFSQFLSSLGYSYTENIQ